MGEFTAGEYIQNDAIRYYRPIPTSLANDINAASGFSVREICDPRIHRAPDLLRSLLNKGVYSKAPVYSPETQYEKLCAGQIEAYNKRPDRKLKNKIYAHSKLGKIGMACTPRILANLEARHNVIVRGQYSCLRNNIRTHSVQQLRRSRLVIADVPLRLRDIFQDYILQTQGLNSAGANIKVIVTKVAGQVTVMTSLDGNLYHVSRSREETMAIRGEMPQLVPVSPLHPKMQSARVGARPGKNVHIKTQHVRTMTEVSKEFLQTAVNTINSDTVKGDGAGKPTNFAIAAAIVATLVTTLVRAGQSDEEQAELRRVLRSGLVDIISDAAETLLQWDEDEPYVNSPARNALESRLSLVTAIGRPCRAERSSGNRSKIDKEGIRQLMQELSDSTVNEQSILHTQKVVTVIQRINDLVGTGLFGKAEDAYLTASSSDTSDSEPETAPPPGMAARHGPLPSDAKNPCIHLKSDDAYDSNGRGVAPGRTGYTIASGGRQKRCIRRVHPQVRLRDENKFALLAGLITH